MVEGSGVANNGYALMTMAADGMIEISGFGKQAGYDWPA
jgi:hypothetical protein